MALHRRWGLLKDNDPGDAEDSARIDLLKRYGALLDRDLFNVREGLYPRKLLFDIPLRRYLKMVPALVKNTPSVRNRRLSGDFIDLPPEVDLERYPPYYRQNFHWQTDGYLSHRSAELYDLGVEMLFVGTADVMRRQTIPPITRFFREQSAAGARLLDVGCGTARTLLQIAHAHPELTSIGIDLSPYYVEVGRRTLAGFDQVSLLAANAEDLPFRDQYFDVATSVFTFHELPRSVRRRVLEELHRVLRPGGLLVIEDSAQLCDGPGLSFFMDRFAREFHEPFYADYVRADLAAELESRGFQIEDLESHFVAKLVTGRKM
jgi:ubiquinone/menaquinone biosynthesis C-methylase UbiE